MKQKKFSMQLFKRFIPYLMAYPKEITLAIFFGLLNGIATVVMTLQIGQSIDLMIGIGRVQFQELFHLLLLFGGVVLVIVLSQWLIQVLSNRLAYLSVAALRKDAFERLNRLPLRYYDQTAHGNIVSRFTNDMDNISIAIAAAFNQLFSGVAIIILSFIFMIQCFKCLLTSCFLLKSFYDFLISNTFSHKSGNVTNNFLLLIKVVLGRTCDQKTD